MWDSDNKTTDVGRPVIDLKVAYVNDEVRILGLYNQALATGNPKILIVDPSDMSWTLSNALGGLIGSPTYTTYWQGTNFATDGDYIYVVVKNIGTGSDFYLQAYDINNNFSVKTGWPATGLYLGVGSLSYPTIEIGDEGGTDAVKFFANNIIMAKDDNSQVAVLKDWSTTSGGDSVVLEQILAQVMLQQGDLSIHLALLPMVRDTSFLAVGILAILATLGSLLQVCLICQLVLAFFRTPAIQEPQEIDFLLAWSMTDRALLQLGKTQLNFKCLNRGSQRMGNSV
jgi:hypothetical protein